MVNLNDRVPTAYQLARRFCGEDYYTRDYIAIQDSFLKELRNAIDNKVNTLTFTGEDHTTGAMMDFKDWLENNGYQISDINKRLYEDRLLGDNITRRKAIWTMKIWWPADYDIDGDLNEIYS